MISGLLRLIASGLAPAPVASWIALLSTTGRRNLLCGLISQLWRSRSSLLLPAETERLFSLAGSICDDLRGRLSGSKTDQLIFCARNMSLLPPLQLQ